ncbi:hypothetical protein GPECTOR_500g462 [Gonium pectorale]|uniref:Ion transport domain-containing protein n=1 Tax=Gonium pectorale TaxID=33097 RepID=A0A150FUY2_GONPE|nr:hypothetical protein GPECTOR_500g462 [Gonium pectorale]|eukprot:KXZ41388.1 hypothetical protein GPECTOR_500g462 [Gonium pectorale]
MVHELKGQHKHWITGVDVSSSHDRVVSAGLDSLVCLWSLASGACLLTLTTHEDGAFACALSSCGRLLMTGGTAASKVYETEYGGELLSLRGHVDRVNVVSFLELPGEDTLQGKLPGTKASDVQSTTPVGGSEKGPSGAVPRLPHRYLTFCVDGSFRLWNATARPVQRAIPHPAGVNAVRLSADARLVATVTSQEGGLRVFELASGQLLLHIKAHDKSANEVLLLPDVTLSPPDSKLGVRRLSGTAVTASNDATVRVWDLSGGGSMLRCLPLHGDWVNALAVGSDGRTLLSASSDRTLKLSDLTTGEVERTLNGHTGGVFGCRFSRDERRVLSLSFDKTMGLWDAASGKELACLRGHTKPVLTAAYTSETTAVSAVHRRTAVAVAAAAAGGDSGGGGGVTALYDMPVDAWRLVLELGIVIMNVWYLYGEVTQIALLGPRIYLGLAGAVWNWIDIATCALILAAVVLRLVASEAERVVLGLAAIALGLKTLKAARGLERTGPLVRMLLRVLLDIRFFLVILGIILGSFCHALFLLFYGTAMLPLPPPDGASDLATAAYGDALSQCVTYGDDYGNYVRAMMTAYRMLLGDYDFAALSSSRFYGVGWVLFVAFTFLVTIIGLNLLIAVMSDSYAVVKEHARAGWLLERARIIVEVEQSVPRSWLERPPYKVRWLHVLTHTEDMDGEHELLAAVTKVIARQALNTDIIKARSEISEQVAALEAAATRQSGVLDKLAADVASLRSELRLVRRELGDEVALGGWVKAGGGGAADGGARTAARLQ